MEQFVSNAKMTPGYQTWSNRGVHKNSLFASEWQKINEICTLLQPFYEYTQLMQADSVALSNVLPVLLDLKCHLQLSQDVANMKMMATSMLLACNKRFSKLLDCSVAGFDPLPSAACYVDPTVSAILTSPNLQGLLSAARSLLFSQVIMVYNTCCSL